MFGDPDARHTGVDCAYRFLNGKTWVHLEGYKNAQLSECLNTVVDPEQKRRIIGDVFMHVREFKMLG